MSDIKTYTEDDFTCEFFDLTYGPACVMTPKDKDYPKYVLKSDENMDKSKWGSKTAKHGIHLAVCHYGDPMHSSDYKGIFETVDMKVAILDVLNELNDNEKIYALEMEIGPLAHQLTGEVDDLVEAMVPFPRRNIDECIENIEIAFVALMARYKEMKEMLFNE